MNPHLLSQKGGRKEGWWWNGGGSDGSPALATIATRERERERERDPKEREGMSETDVMGGRRYKEVRGYGFGRREKRGRKILKKND